MTPATWYFDFLSPFAYLQFTQFGKFATELDVTLKPVLFPGLLKHWGQLGPAEIPPKRRFVYRFFKWHADRRGVPFKMPPVHPFNPLPPLRLAVAAGATMESVRLIFSHLYGEGSQLDSDQAIAGLGRKIGVHDAVARLSDQRVKDALRANTEEAIAKGVFGVPTFIVEGELFWGDDATEMLRDFLNDRKLFDNSEMTRLSTMPMGHTRSQQ